MNANITSKMPFNGTDQAKLYPIQINSTNKTEIEMPEAKKKYDSAIKEQAVKRLLNEQISAVKLAEEMNIDANLLRQWKSRFLNEYSKVNHDDSENMSLEERNIHLQTRVEQLKNDINVLKKAFAIMIREI